MTAGTWRDALRRARRDWPGKLGAVLAALLVWWVASSEPTQTTQRSLLVPLQVTGAEEDEVAVGVPTRVEVVITGPSDRMERLRAADVDALLDLADIDGGFERPIETRVPQTLQVTRVVPSEVIGRLEAVRSASFPVDARVAPAADGRVLTNAVVDPDSVVVEARDPVLELVAAVVAPVPRDAPDDATAVLVPIDAEGRPVPEARVVPETAAVRLEREARRSDVVRPVSLSTLDDPLATVEGLLPAQIGLVGPPDVLRDLPAVPGAVPDVTGTLPPGRYDLPVRLSLPEGVAAFGPVVATVRIAEPPAPTEEDADAEPDDDAPDGAAP